MRLGLTERLPIDGNRIMLVRRRRNTDGRIGVLLILLGRVVVVVVASRVGRRTRRLSFHLELFDSIQVGQRRRRARRSALQRRRVLVHLRA